MKECICSTCRNLKGMIGENGSVEEYVCEFGYPSEEACCECETEECDLTCSHYLCDEEQTETRILFCKACGKELRQVCSDVEEGDVFCMDCYLKNI